MKKKIIGIFVCVLIIGVSVVSSASNVNKNEHDKIIVCNEVQQINNNRELISIITGTCSDYKLTNNGLIRKQVELWSNGSTHITIRGSYIYLGSLNGIMGFTVNGLHYLWIKNFIGYINRISPQSCRVFGFALGDIFWY